LPPRQPCLRWSRARAPFDAFVKRAERSRHCPALRAHRHCCHITFAACVAARSARNRRGSYRLLGSWVRARLRFRAIGLSRQRPTVLASLPVHPAAL
jgi:hypothetical protein